MNRPESSGEKSGLGPQALTRGLVFAASGGSLEECQRREGSSYTSQGDEPQTGNEAEA
jgi:hypothetical protein